MSDDRDNQTPWWHTFFDMTYAEVGFTAADPEHVARTVEFLHRVLELTERTRLFDQCCGIGRLSLPLARRGVHVIGVDRTAAYIEQARQAAADEGLPAEFHCADAFQFVADPPCDAAINWFTSFGYHQDDSVNVRVLQRAFESLRPGATFALDYLSIPKVFRRFQHRTWLGPDPALPDSVTVVEEPTPDFARGMIDSVWTFIHPDGHREQRRIATRMYMPHEIVGLLIRCGFGAVELYGSVEGESFGLDAPRCIAVARKPGDSDRE
ncbi:MAG: class I SAM-dependent methyltransferase [Planctomycetota bacterium]|jgi:SAM-dependent methyltransferase